MNAKKENSIEKNKMNAKKENSIEKNKAIYHHKQIWKWALFAFLGLIFMVVFCINYTTHETLVYSIEGILTFWFFFIVCLLTFQSMKHWARFNSYMNIVKAE